MRKEMWFFVIFISVFYCVGFGLVGYALISVKRSTDAAAWPTVTGALEICRLDSNIDSDGDTHEVKVTYRYTVDGSAFTNDVLAFGYTASSGEEAHQEIFDRLNGASEVQVRYDPANPQNSVLSCGIHRSIQFTLAFAITWLLFVMGFSLLWWVAERGDDVLLRNLITQ